MTDNDCQTNQASPLVGSETRAPWTSPRVIVSDLGDARASVSNGADGSSPSYGPYGS